MLKTFYLLLKLLKFQNSDNTKQEINKNIKNDSNARFYSQNSEENSIDQKDECLFDTILIDYIKFTKEKFLLDYVRFKFY